LDPLARAGLRLDIDDNISSLMREIQAVLHKRRDEAKLGAAGKMSAERTAQIVVLGVLYALEMQQGATKDPNIKRALEKKIAEVVEHVKVLVRKEGGGGILAG
jgi:hypothetical protein